MSKSPPQSPHEYELLPRTSLEAQDRPELERSTSNPSWLQRLSQRLPSKLSNRSVYTHYVTRHHRKRSVIRFIFWAVFYFPFFCLFLVLVAAIFFPSYTTLPTHYEDLRQRALASDVPGRANPHSEKIFISSSLYETEGQLTSGTWASAVLELIDLLGPDNVHLSIYEDNADAVTKKSLVDLKKRVTCNSTIVFEDLNLSTLPRITLPTGETRLKRIAFLADVRNRALAPIDANGVKFDKILYLNDVIFKPIDAIQLLFATNIDSAGRTNYGAACAVDFINPFKFYDRFATRDLDGRITGLPFYPWFTSAGTATSRNDVLSQSDAVRVRSCWGGMTAYEAKWFQDPTLVNRGSASTSPNEQTTSPNTNVSQLRFRYEEDTFWEASECCLVNADLQYRRTGRGMPSDSGIYMNPYIRVAYDEKTLSWLSLVRRPERLYSIIHDILNPMVGFPSRNERLGEEPGSIVTDTVWEFDDPVRGLSPNATEADRAGHYTELTRTAKPGSFSSIICVDVIIRQFPGKKDFKIEDSNTFLSSGLSLSFGVMIFSSLYSMLPSAKNYLTKAGMSPRNATFTLVGCFLLGALGIFFLSSFLHQFIPHSVVDCDHEHGDEEEGKVEDEEAGHEHGQMEEQRGRLSQVDGGVEADAHRSYGTTSEHVDPKLSATRPPLHTSLSTKVSQLVLGGKKKSCDEDGQCFGFADTCGTECFRNALTTRPQRLQSTKSTGMLPTARPSGIPRNQTTQGLHERSPLLRDVDGLTLSTPTLSGPTTMDSSISSLHSTHDHHNHNHAHSHTHEHAPLQKRTSNTSLSTTSSHASHTHTHDHNGPQHHHHVPTNIFLSIGLQTSTAIALHKIPEGFITYATNHANPRLGLSIFLALFIHNITEGFALALPLYLAINSRWKAMFWSALLGGVSQPLGAGVAALWFGVAGRGNGGGMGEHEDLVYGCMFAATAGIMAMVSLQLLGESLDLTHSRRLCFASAFAGMGILGLSSALTA
ncbi:glycosyltransferase family 69 protein [Dothidotthia symphoricarpi CBS 119687]|uniref:Glycosyltransferase family 69 protein n=1 Tax=Dothidotthia symphoricarpi CBS 119687 TaxID=1392245 RepID=A0A6A6A541_9PLEO|nr:glycosyltransferase family 69 protein [Dothidotthia symphoricarpi CBS 119687]KAF2126244.1 glycosyltransferase family 69 protein [Dothidotthia symphoricarpi CBS 119687]